MRGIRAINSWMVAFWMMLSVTFLISIIMNIFLNYGNAKEIDYFLQKWHLSGNYETLVTLCFSVSIVSLVLLVFKMFSWLRNFKRCNKLENFLFKITTLPDEEAVNSLQILGLVVSRDNLDINVKMLDLASPEALSHAITFLLYLESRDSLDEWLVGNHNVFHHLADVLLENAHDEAIKKFVAYMKKEKVYLGQLLDSALVRRELEHEANDLLNQIEQVIEQERSVLDHARKFIESDLKGIRQIIPDRISG